LLQTLLLSMFSGNLEGSNLKVFLPASDPSMVGPPASLYSCT